MMRDIRREIANCLLTGQQFEEMSDQFFAKGDPARGAQYYRLAVETFRRAETLAAGQLHLVVNK